jgi:alpha-N-arabinofuranosidase
LRGAQAQKISGRMVSATEITAHNTFDKPELVKPSEFKAFKVADNGFITTLPPKSVVVLEVD